VKAYGGRLSTAPLISLTPYLEYMSDQLHALIVSSAGKNPLVPPEEYINIVIIQEEISK
jgi:hypothetical protein